MSDHITPIPWADVLIILALIALNGVFAMSELAIVSSREARLKAMAKSGSGGARCALDLAAEPGRFLVGVAPGKWGLRVSGRNHSGEELVVPEGGEARIRMRVPRPGVEEPDDAPKGEPREVEVSTGNRNLGRWAFVRAEARPGLFFRSEVVASAASFPALPAGKWTFVLQAPESPEERFAAEVPAGAGPLRLSFPEPAPVVAAPK